MKKLLLIAYLVFPMSIFASSINFECKSSEVNGIHKFDAFGFVTITDKEGKADGVVTIRIQKAQAIESIQTFYEVRVSGYLRYFDDGFNNLLLLTNNEYLKSLNILLDFEEPLASKILSIDNFHYKSTCKIIERN